MSTGSILGNTIYPYLSRVGKESPAKFFNISSLLFKMLLIAGLLLFMLAFLFGRKVILLFYGSEYIPSISVFRILSMGIVTSYGSVTFAFSLLALGKQKLHLYAYSCGSLVNVILNTILIPWIGMVGAAIATLAGELCILAMLYWYFREIKMAQQKAAYA